MLRLRPTWLAMLCFLSLAGLTRCASSTPQYVATEPRDEAIYVIAGGWHTELAMPVSAISAPLATLELGSGNARYLVFGWGAHDYYMARDPGFGDLLRAVVPGPAVLLVIPLRISPEAFGGPANVFAVAVSRSGAEHLSQFLWEYLVENVKGAPQRVGPGPYPGSVFYASTGTFDLAHTCNTWTAEALRAAGLPVSSAGIVYAKQLLDQLRPLAVASPL